MPGPGVLLHNARCKCRNRRGQGGTTFLEPCCRSCLFSRKHESFSRGSPMEENVLTPRPPRSLVRRLVVVGFAMALLLGGGWGVYHYTIQASAQLSDHAASDAASASATPRDAPSAAEELKNLFAAEAALAPPTKEKKSQVLQADLTRSQPDRYAVKAVESSLALGTPGQGRGRPGSLEKLDGEDQRDKVESPVSDVSSNAMVSAPQTLVGDRYGTPPELPATSTQTELPVKSQLDVARGQEPSDVNPLRTSAETQGTAPIDAAPTAEARAAFGQMAAPVNPIRKSKEESTALENARPLRPVTPAKLAKATPDRYQSAEPGLADPPTPKVGTPIAENPPREPLPAFGIDSPPAAPQENKAPAASPIAASSRNDADITPTPGLANKPGTGRPGESLLEGAQSPSITVQKLAPEEIQVGKRCTYAIRVQNTGQRAAQNVQIHDEVPLGTELIGTSPRAMVSGSSVVWDLGMLSTGEERIVEMELIPTDEGELGSVATVSFAVQASAKARSTRPELVLRLSSKPRVHVGQQQLVQIEVSNPGSGDATGVVLLETVPAGVSHEAGPAVEFEVGTLRAGESRRMELVLNAQQAGKISNVMTARADAGLQVQAACEFEIIAPELQLTVQGPQRRYLERPATYFVSVDNPGTAAAKEVELVTHLPKGLQFVSANNMGEYDSATHSVYWSLAELPANERGTVELVALPVEAGEQTLQVGAKSRQGLEDRTEKQVIVEGLAALMFEVVDVEDPIEIGGETTYEIRVVNQGSKAASNVQITAIMPSGLKALSGEGETRFSIQGERVVFAPLPQLAPKADVMFRIQAQGQRPGDQRIRVQLTTDEIQQPITKEESTRVYADQ